MELRPLFEEVALHNPQPLLRHDRKTTSIQCFVESHLVANHFFDIPTKVSAVRRTIATVPCTLAACFLHTAMSLKSDPAGSTAPKYSFNQATIFFSRVVSAVVRIQLVCRLATGLQ